MAVQTSSAAQRLAANLILGAFPQLGQALLIWYIGQIAVLRAQHDGHLQEQAI